MIPSLHFRHGYDGIWVSVIGQDSYMNTYVGWMRWGDIRSRFITNLNRSAVVGSALKPRAELGSSQIQSHPWTHYLNHVCDSSHRETVLRETNPQMVWVKRSSRLWTLSLTMIISSYKFKAWSQQRTIKAHIQQMSNIRTCGKVTLLLFLLFQKGTIKTIVVWKPYTSKEKLLLYMPHCTTAKTTVLYFPTTVLYFP